MLRRWAGPTVVVLILGGVIAILALNLNLNGRNAGGGGDGARPRLEPAPLPQGPAIAPRPPAGFREYPIGDEVEKNQIRIAAVYLPPVGMDGMDMPASSALIHLEADIHATEGNRNGFAKDEFVPYLVVHYTIVPDEANGKAKAPSPSRARWRRWSPAMGCIMAPTSSFPKPAASSSSTRSSHRPPEAWAVTPTPPPVSTPWWDPFEVSFDWDYPGPPK